MKIKICGLRREEDISYVNQCLPDYIGFVFAGKKRKIDYDSAKLLKSELASSIKAVGVFVNEDIEYIVRLVRDDILDMVQLHGDEDESYILELRNRLSHEHKPAVPIIKAVRVRSGRQVEEADKLPVDYLLLDAFSKDEYGGSGETFKHELIPEISRPYFLAGGIDYKNVIKILKNISLKNVTMPIGVDVSSSVETDGYKDFEKIRNMVQIIKDYE